MSKKWRLQNPQALKCWKNWTCKRFWKQTKEVDIHYIELLGTG
jgi:hypothetical protein